MVLLDSTILRKKAKADLQCAMTMRDTSAELTSITCYHIQQYVEKMLKAKLTDLGIGYSKTHDIGQLLELFPDDRLSEGFIEEADRLTGYCVNTRYDDYDPSFEEMMIAFEIANRIVSVSESL